MSTRDLLIIFGFIIIFAICMFLFVEGQNVAASLTLLFLLIFSGMPVFLGLGVLGTIGLYFAVGQPGLIQLPLTIYGSLNSWELSCLPLFIFSGIILFLKIAEDIFNKDNATVEK